MVLVPNQPRSTREQAMNITCPILSGATRAAEIQERFAWTAAAVS
jgi:hypothetical protein